ncbi:MAG: hypothetical protein RR341_07620, partial [Bacteroidales bacterium]
MKRAFYLLIVIILSDCNIFAQGDCNLPVAQLKSDSVSCRRSCDFVHSLDLLGFEKRLNDKNELFIIRNNTDETITLV